MIDSEKTPDYLNISIGSNKLIYLKCDYCGSDIESTKKKREKSNKFCNKDSCNNCRYKKRQDVSLARDGVKNSAQKEIVKDKIRNSNSQRLKSEEFKIQSKKTMVEKYGEKNAMKVPEIIEKQKNTLLDKYGVDNIMKVPEICKAASAKSIKTRIENGYILSIDGETLPQHAKNLGWSRSHFGKLVRRYGFEEAVRHEKKFSSIENIIMNLLNSENINYDQQFRVDGKIADFKIEDLIIECDGLYWHSDIFLSEKYHSDKKNVYTKNGFKSLFFREDEIRDKLHIVKSIIKNAMGKNTNKYFARKLAIKEISSIESRDFMSKYHLMGGNNSSTYSYSLGDVAVIQFKRLKNNDYDIARFCTKSESTVIGGFSKLISHFIKIVKPDSISTFIDMRYGSGEYLKDIGFKEVSCYNSFKWTDGTNTYHRLKFPGNSGYQAGLYKIWDCGQKKYLLR